MTSLFSNDYLPDRLDIQDVDSIAYMEFVETQKRKNDCIYHAIEKIEEIQEDLFNFPCTSNWLTIDWAELHYYLFNEDYFLIGFYNCKKWLGDSLLNAINLIKDYELFNFEIRL